MAKNNYTFDEIENMNEEDFLGMLEGITDDQALDSDIGGDSDADDSVENTNIPRPHNEEIININEEINIEEPEAEQITRVHWSKRRNDPEEFKNTKFKEYCGINTEVDIGSPLNIFQIYFSNFLCNLIISETNLYASQHGVDLNLSNAEFNAFLGILVIMGFHRLPGLRMYWSTNPNFNVSRISKIMSLKRFLKILRYLHVNDNTKMPARNSPGFDRLYKIRPLLSYFSKKFGEVFRPSRYLSVDESMVAFKGRTTLKQYMPMKPIKRGFKIWVICCAVTGYMLNFQVYEGKNLSGDGVIGLGEKVVMYLTHPYAYLGYCVFFDRFFSSFSLVYNLLRKKLFGCGTILQTRKFFPKNKLCADKELTFGNSDFATSKSISVVKWKDRGTKSVCVVSNMHKASEETKIKRTNKQGEKEEVSCPRAISDYNMYMGGVDRFDQLLSSYDVSWKSRRWWLKIFYYLLNCCIVNSFILYKQTIIGKHNREKPMTQLIFRSILADALIKNYKSKKPQGRQTIITQNDTVEGQHWISKGTCRRCAFCSTVKNPKRTVYMCKQCDVPLCVLCFEHFHINKCEKL